MFPLISLQPHHVARAGSVQAPDLHVIWVSLLPAWRFCSNEDCWLCPLSNTLSTLASRHGKTFVTCAGLWCWNSAAVTNLFFPCPYLIHRLSQTPSQLWMPGKSILNCRTWVRTCWEASQTHFSLWWKNSLLRSFSNDSDWSQFWMWLFEVTVIPTKEATLQIWGYIQQKHKDANSAHWWPSLGSLLLFQDCLYGWREPPCK